MQELVNSLRERYGISEQAAKILLEKAASQAAQIKEQERKIRKARSLTYEEWLDTEHSDPLLRWDYPWIQHVLEYIEALIRRDIYQLIINIPPRTGKSELVTIRLPVFWLECYPRARVIVGAYGADLAEGFAQASLRIYKERNPDEVNSEAREEWTNKSGGSVKPVGVGGGVTGRGADLLLIDDPVKSAQEANSPAYQNRVWEWWNKDLKTRRNRMDRTPTLLIMTRWHDQDLTGKILDSPTAKDWTHIVVPALAFDQARRDMVNAHNGLPAGLPDPLGRTEGESILPDRMPVDSLLKAEMEDPVGFSALFQQLPIQVSSASFKVEKFEFVGEVPRRAHRVRYWDYAATAGGGDFCVGVLMALDDDNYPYIEDVVRGQWSDDEVEKQIKLTAELDWQRYGNDPDHVMQTWIEQEPAASGKQTANHIARNVLKGFDAHVNPTRDSKGTRARPWASAVNRGEARIKKNPDWNSAYINEHRVFVIGIDNKRDDQVDASSGAYLKLTLELTRVTMA